MNFAISGQAFGLGSLLILGGIVGVVLIVAYAVLTRGVVPAVEEPLEARAAEDEDRV